MRPCDKWVLFYKNRFTSHWNNASMWIFKRMNSFNRCSRPTRQPPQAVLALHNIARDCLIVLSKIKSVMKLTLAAVNRVWLVCDPCQPKITPAPDPLLYLLIPARSNYRCPSALSLNYVTPRICHLKIISDWRREDTTKRPLCWRRVQVKKQRLVYQWYFSHYLG